MQVGVLALNAGLIAWYLHETGRTRLAAERQVEVGQQQLEAQTKAALIARLPENSQLVELLNIGSGPSIALGVHVSTEGIAGISSLVSSISSEKRHPRAGRAGPIRPRLLKREHWIQRMRLLASTKEWLIRNIWTKSGQKRTNFLISYSLASPELPGPQS